VTAYIPDSSESDVTESSSGSDYETSSEYGDDEYYEFKARPKSGSKIPRDDN